MPRIQARAGPRHQHSSSPLIQEGQIHHLLGLDQFALVEVYLDVGSMFGGHTQAEAVGGADCPHRIRKRHEISHRGFLLAAGGDAFHGEDAGVKVRFITELLIISLCKYLFTLHQKSWWGAVGVDKQKQKPSGKPLGLRLEGGGAT